MLRENLCGWLLYFHMGPIDGPRDAMGSVKPCYKFLYFGLSDR